MLKRFMIRTLAIVLVFSCSLAAPVFAADSAAATTMRLERTERTVSLTGKNEKSLVITEGMKLASGNTLTTKAKSYAYISLDDKKAVKLDGSSSAEVQKSGKKLEVLLNSGKLFFNVKVPLESDESLNVRSSTMTAGVRGTAGVIEIVNDQVSKLHLLEGTVQLTDYSSPSGKARVVTVQAGQTATCVSSTGSAGDAAVSVEKMEVSAVPGFAAVEIARDPQLADKIRKQSSLDVDSMISGAQSRLDQDEAAQLKRQQAAGSAVKENIIADSGIFRDRSSAVGSGGGGGGNSGGNAPTSPAEPTPDSITLTGAVTADMAKAALTSFSAVTIANGAAPSATTLTIQDGESVTVPAGRSLTLERGTQTTIDGSLDVAGTLVDSGLIQCNVGNAVAVSDTGVFQFKGGILWGVPGLSAPPIHNTGAFQDSSGSRLSVTGACVLNEGSTYMESLNDVFAALTGDSNRLRLVTSSPGANPISGDLVLPAGVGVSLDLSSYELSLGQYSITVEDGASISLSGTGIISANETVLRSAGRIDMSGTFTLRSRSGSAAALEISGGDVRITGAPKIYGGSSAITGAAPASHLTISGGTLQSDSGYAVTWAGTGEMTGGTVYGYRHAGSGSHIFTLRNGSVLEPISPTAVDPSFPAPVKLEADGFVVEGGAAAVIQAAFASSVIDNEQAPFRCNSGAIVKAAGGQYFADPDNVEYTVPSGCAGLSNDENAQLSYGIYDNPKSIVEQINTGSMGIDTVCHLYLRDGLELDKNIMGYNLSITGVGDAPVTISGNYFSALVTIQQAGTINNVVIVNNSTDTTSIPAALAAPNVPDGLYTLKAKSEIVCLISDDQHIPGQYQDDGYYTLTSDQLRSALL